MLGEVWWRRVDRVTLISILSAAFLAGLALSRVGLSVPFAIAAASSVLLWLCRKRRLVLAVPSVVIIGLLVGLWRGADMLRQIDAYVHVVDQKVTVQGIVVQDSTYGTKGQI